MLGPRRVVVLRISLENVGCQRLKSNYLHQTIKPRIFLIFLILPHIINVFHHLFFPSVLFDIFLVAMPCVAEEGLTCDKKEGCLTSIFPSDKKERLVDFNVSHG